MSVRDDWQRRGVGTALMTVAIDIADNWINYRRLELTVYTDNVAALALYRKFGFEIEGTHKDYAFRDGRHVDAFTMARVRTAASAATKQSTTQSTKKGPNVHRKGTRTSRKRNAS